ncbi:hypothetical protein J2X04_002691 [Lysobacter niabensis]|uniref:Uncharacterized protein n=1 Tax=Agrilutibacter niabensis TaxID=380628 RepID=A0ABU1VSH5_9GAMM|nr:hypothetical protein [Lysobacter niabensis]MDR7100310.1 hypothetical protein [Lysobacter niabensis]
MHRGEYKESRLRNWLALLLMALAAIAAGRSQAASPSGETAHPPISLVGKIAD